MFVTFDLQTYIKYLRQTETFTKCTNIESKKHFIVRLLVV